MTASFIFFFSNFLKDFPWNKWQNILHSGKSIIFINHACKLTHAASFYKRRNNFYIFSVCYHHFYGIDDNLLLQERSRILDIIIPAVFSRPVCQLIYRILVNEGQQFGHFSQFKFLLCILHNSFNLSRL